MDECEELNGFIVYTINVGYLPPYKAEAFVARMKDCLNEKKLEPKVARGLQGWRTICLPVRPPQRTKVQIFLCKEGGDIQPAKQWVKQIEYLLEERLFHNMNMELSERDQRILDLEDQVDDLITANAELETQIDIYKEMLGMKGFISEAK